MPIVITVLGYICLLVVLVFLARGLYKFGKFDDIEKLSPLNQVIIPLLAIASIFSDLGTNNRLYSIALYSTSVIVVGGISYLIGYLKRNSD